MADPAAGKGGRGLMFKNKGKDAEVRKIVFLLWDKSVPVYFDFKFSSLSH